MMWWGRFILGIFLDGTSLLNMKSSKIRGLIQALKKNKLFTDSFWAVFGNGIGQLFLLIAGIVIARILGKDLYGEYGIVKTNMFYMAGFATFGLVYSSTKFIAQYINKDSSKILCIIKTSTGITILFSVIIALLIIIFSRPLAIFLEVPDLSDVFKFLSLVIVFKAVCSTGTGILSGLGEFKLIARNSLLSGILMFILSIPLTYYGGLKGSLFTLALSQLFNAIINYIAIYRNCRCLSNLHDIGCIRELVKFSVPIALQEISFAICNWFAITILTKLSSVGEVGIYSATAQWNAVVLFIPGLLANVILSHFSASVDDKEEHKSTVKKTLLMYLICTIIPFLFVYSLSGVITSLYGPAFSDMRDVLNLLIFATIPICCSDVFKAELLALGKPWLLFSLRLLKDIILLVLTYCLLVIHDGLNGAYDFSIATLAANSAFFILLLISYKIIIKRQDSR